MLIGTHNEDSKVGKLKNNYQWDNKNKNDIRYDENNTTVNMKEIGMWPIKKNKLNIQDKTQVISNELYSDKI